MPSTITTTTQATIAELLPTAAARHGDHVALRERAGEGWRETSYRELAEQVQAIARGLVALGVEAGERVAILAETSADWTRCDLAVTAAGGIVVPIYATSSAQEVSWVLCDSGAVAAICGDKGHLARVLAARADAPTLRTLVSLEPAAGACSLAELVERGRGVDAGEPARRASAVADADPYTFIYTSGTTGPAKGCMLTHRNFRAVLDAIRDGELLMREGDLTYLYLPLAHAFALIMQLASLQEGATIAYAGGDVQRIPADLVELAPTFLPSVPRIFEKVYAAVTRDVGPMTLRDAVRVGSAVQTLQRDGAPVPAELREVYEQYDERLFARVRAAFGGRMRLAVTGAAPVAVEILEFLWAAGVPVMEGYGMTETASAISICTLATHRFGTVGRPLPGVEVRIAPDGEILARGENVFAGYHNGGDSSFGEVADGWLHTGDVGVLDGDGFLSITGRKKDLIITAGGKNIAPANLENDLKQSRWISQAVMYGDRRAYPVVLVTLDAEEIAPWACERGLPSDIASLAREPQVLELIAAELASANARYARAEQAKRFAILERDLSQEAGELTPTLKVKRDVVARNHEVALERLYG